MELPWPLESQDWTFEDRCDQRSGWFDVPVIGFFARTLGGDKGSHTYFENIELKNGWVVDTVHFKVDGAADFGKVDVDIVPPGPRLFPGTSEPNPLSNFQFGVGVRIDSGIGAYVEEAPGRGATNPFFKVRWWVNLDAFSGHDDCYYQGTVRVTGPKGKPMF